MKNYRTKINVKNILLQNALSGELNVKLSEWRNLKEEIGQIMEEYSEMTEKEEFLEDEWHRLQMQTLEKEFLKKQKEFQDRAVILRLIFLSPVYMN